MTTTATKRDPAKALLTGNAKLQKADVVVDGDIAAKIVIPIGSEAVHLTDEQEAQRRKLENELENLKLLGEAIPESELQQSALPILLKLARIYQEAEAEQEKVEEADKTEDEVGEVESESVEEKTSQPQDESNS